MIPTISCRLPNLRIVVLAAGFSTRLGNPKALSRVQGTSLLHRTLRVLAPFAASSKLIVVIPPRAHRYRVGAACRNVDFLVNRRRRDGLSSSVRAGIKRSQYSAAVLLLPVDLVRLEPRDVARLISRWRGGRRKIVARRVHGAAATPLILPRAWYAAALKIAGDQGLRDFVRHLPDEHLRLVELPSAAADVDTPHDLQRARRRFPAASRRR